MIYFDTNKEAYQQRETLEKWGKTYLTECTEIEYQELQEGKLMWQGDEIVENPDYDSEQLVKAKEQKIQENNIIRDEALNQGVTYKDVLFDSDTDQKVNLLAIVSTMNDEDTIIWFGMDNQPLECTKQDLINIGGLITQLHNFCWNKNALIKAEINNAETIEEVEAIEIDYATPYQMRLLANSGVIQGNKSEL